MRLPVELIAAIILAKVFQDPAFGAGAGRWLLPAAAALLIGGSWAVPRLGWAAMRRRLRRNPELRPALFEEHARLMTGARCFTVAAYAAFLYWTGFSALVTSPAGLNAGCTVIGDDLLQLLPYLLASLALWAGDFPASRELGPADWGLGEYLRQQTRGTLLLLGPWLALVLVFDSLPYWPWGLAALFERSPAAEFGLTALVFAAAALFFPLYLVRLWPAERLGDGQLRSRLEALLARAHVRCRELMVWKTGRGRVPNAALMGLVAPLRYVVFTDALLGELSAEELEAVLAHEAGHARHHHLAYYLVFAVGFGPFALTVAGLLPEPLRASRAAGAALLLALVLTGLIVLYWRVIFGYLSRRFEREADAAACELVGSPAPLIGALEKLAAASGAPRAARSWRHYSVADRVAFLERFGAERAALGRYHAYVRQVKLATVAAVALLALNTALQVLAGAEPETPGAPAERAKLPASAGATPEGGSRP